MLLSFSAFSSDRTEKVYELYNNPGQIFSVSDLTILKKSRIIFVPGILAESFIEDDRRSRVELSFLTTEYFGKQIQDLKKKFNLDIIRLSTSSKSLDETKENIRRALIQAKVENKRVFFVSHSLGGLALLDFFLRNENSYSQVLGSVFYQSPFLGTGIADTYLDNPYYIRRILKPILPFLNTSEDIITSMSSVSRIEYMDSNNEGILNLIKSIPVLTVAGNANGVKSIFEPSIDILKYGCIKVLGKCVTRKVYKGRLDNNDGMVSVFSSKLPETNYVILKRVDHGETVVNAGFKSIDRVRMTMVLIKNLLSNSKQF
jgi:hypothetical protein